MEQSHHQVSKLGMFKKIYHLKSIFQIFESFLADGKTFFTLVSLNKTFRNLTHYKFDLIMNVVKHINNDPNKFLLFSPYSWLHNPDTFEICKTRFMNKMEEYNLDDIDFINLFNLCRRFNQVLDFDNFGLDVKGANILFKYFRNFNNVKVLILSYCKIDIIAFDTSIGELIKKCKMLEQLRLENNNLNQHCGKLIRDSLIQKEHLQLLNLSGNSLKDGFLNVATFLNANESLRDLNIAHTNLSEKGLNVLSECLNPRKNIIYLCTLNLSSNFLEDKSTMQNFIYCITDNKFLINLILSNCGIDEEICSYISVFLTKNKSLKFLNVSKNKITDKGFYVIINALKQNNSLETLNISYNLKITDVAFENIFVEKFNDIKLYYLNYEGNKYFINEEKFKISVLSSKRKWKIKFDYMLDSDDLSNLSKLVKAK